MHDPVIAEICRSNPDSIRPDVFRRWQQYLSREVDPKLQRLAEEADRKSRRKAEEPAA